MNIHHLELFYYVARHGGIMPAVRNIPYGIQQPAVSGQIAQLEEHLGTTLFQRRPFSLTPAGKKLYAAVEPFFSGLGALETELQGGEARIVRIGASGIVLRDHLPGLVQTMRKKFPTLKLALRTALQPELESMLLRDEIDLAISLVEQKPASGLRTLPLIELPLVLLVPKKSSVTDAGQLWAQDKISEPLISLPPSEMIARNFHQGLEKLGVDWFVSIEANSLDLIDAYVAAELGIGVSVALPKQKPRPDIRELPLPGFTPIKLGALWRGKLSPLLQAVLDEVKRRAKLLG